MSASRRVVRHGVAHPPVTIPIMAVHGLLSGVAGGSDRGWIERLAERAGISPALLRESGARVTGQQYVDLFRSLMERLDDECVGLLSRPLRRGSFALVARSAIGAPDLAVAMKRMRQGFGLLIDDVTFEVVEEGDLTGLLLTPRPGLPQPGNFFFELLLRVCWRLLSWLKGRRLMAARFDFCFLEPDYAAIYADIFPGPLRYAQKGTAVWFERAALAAPVRRDAAALETFLSASPANLVLPWLGERTTSGRVYALLRNAGPAWPDLPSTAESLHMSVSTLQRRLSAEHTSFQAIKDQLRRDLAIVWLGTRAEPLANLAAELGFTDCAAFQRAFKCWTGSPPGAYRSYRTAKA